MMKVSVHLSFNGTCEEAFATYTRVLDGTPAYSMRYRESPMANQVPPDWQDKLYHATIEVGGITILGGDHLPKEEPQGFSLVINPATPDDARRVFDALADGGVIQMPLDETFWSPAFGVVVDRFGVPWTINCELAAAPAAG
jgi:PhnB protein